MHAVKALAFDTGGTILDWHSGLVASQRVLRAARRRALEAIPLLFRCYAN
jgi:hypothetical protein